MRFLLVWCAAFASTLLAADITVMTSGALTAAHLQLAPRFERQTGHKVITATTTMGTGENSIPNRMRRGETADLIIVEDGALAGMIESGLVSSAGRTPLARSGIGMAVRAGAPKPDIGTLDALKRTLLEARSIAHSASVSGRYLTTELFPRLGVADQIRDKCRQIDKERVGAVVARGEAEIGFQQISELRESKGIDIVGPLPEGAQKISLFTGGVASASKNAEAARDYLLFLANGSAAAVMRETGLDPIQ
jgi:molybdate transport system substrate-binding protein